MQDEGVIVSCKRRKINEHEQEKLSDEFTIAIDALTSASQIIDSRIANLKERELNVGKRIKEMEDMEARIIAAETRIESDTQDVITLNVGMLSRLILSFSLFFFLTFYIPGGTHFATSKATLLRHKNAYFEEMIKTGQCLKGEYVLSVNILFGFFFFFFFFFSFKY
jgi:hypothetical protein